MCWQVSIRSCPDDIKSEGKTHQKEDEESEDISRRETFFASEF
jgi:hypothetical protein